MVSLNLHNIWRSNLGSSVFRNCFNELEMIMVALVRYTGGDSIIIPKTYSRLTVGGEGHCRNTILLNKTVVNGISSRPVNDVKSVLFNQGMAPLVDSGISAVSHATLWAHHRFWLSQNKVWLWLYIKSNWSTRSKFLCYLNGSMI